MVTIERAQHTAYRSEFGTAELGEVARRTHRLPAEYYDGERRLPTDAFREYAAPLVGELSPFSTIDDLPVV